jgi:hypothetical protein
MSCRVRQQPDEQVRAAEPATGEPRRPEAPDARTGMAAAGNMALRRALDSSGTDGGSGGDGPARAVAVLGLHGLHGLVGNAAVQRAVSPGGRAAVVQRQEGHPPAPAPSPSTGGFQLRPPELGGSAGWRPQGGGEFQLHLDPEIEAQIRALQAMQELLKPDSVALALAQLTLPSLPPNLLPPSPAGPGALAPPPAAPAAPAPPPQAGTPVEPRPGTGGDIWRAIQAEPTIGPAVQQLQEQAIEQARQDWAALSRGEKAVVVSTGVLIGGGALAGVLSSPEARSWVGSTLGGTVYPVPLVPGLGVQLNLGGDNVILGLHFDVGRYLPSVLGFGPGSPKALGSPPSPVGPAPAQRTASGDAPPPVQGSDLAGKLDSASRGGAPLAPTVRAPLEDQLGASLSAVRIHTDSQAADLARSVAAVAFTTGQHIYFSAGAYQPDSAAGKKLLAHEAVHTIQQAAGPVDGVAAGPVSISDPSDRFEREATRVSERQEGDVAVGHLLNRAPVVQRWAEPQSAQQVLDALGAATEAALRTLLASLDNVAGISGDHIAVSLPDRTSSVALADGTELRNRAQWRLAERRMEALAQARGPIEAQGRMAATDEVRRQLTDQLLAIDGPFLDEIRALTAGRPNRYAHPDPAVSASMLAALQLDAVAHAMADLGDQANAHANAARAASMGMGFDWCGFFSGRQLMQAGFDRDLRSGLYHVDNVSNLFQYRWAERSPQWIWADERWQDVHDYHAARNSLRTWAPGAALAAAGGDIQPGDVLLVDTDGNGSANHIVLVQSYNPLTRRVVTIGGNDSGLVLEDRANPPPPANDSESRREAATGRALRPAAGLPAGHVGVGEQDLTERRANHAQVFGIGRPSIVDFEDHVYSHDPVRPTLPPGTPAPRPRTAAGR